MMNALKVPARVVGGYLGGELNPYGSYITVRQSFAHAWVEVFLPDAGWIRVDPTLVVAALFFRFYPRLLSRTATDPVAEAYTLFCRRLATAGLEKSPDQGPVDFLEKITRLRPDLSSEARAIIDLYIQIRFGRTTPDDRIQQLATLVKRFKPSRQAKPATPCKQETHS